MDDQEYERLRFAATQESPIGWYLEALSLKAAADRINPVSAPVLDEEPTLSFTGVHALLLGLSFENLIKGFISTVRLETGVKPVLDKKAHLHHDLRKLATVGECAELCFAEEELVVLDRLTPYVTWAGRYPLPKYINEIFPQIWSPTYEAEEEALWQRIAPVLHGRGWVQKVGPDGFAHKLYADKRIEKAK